MMLTVDGDDALGRIDDHGTEIKNLLVFLMSGLGNMGAMEGYFPLFRFSGPSGMYTAGSQPPCGQIL